MRPRQLIGSFAARVRAALVAGVPALTVTGRTTSAGFDSSIAGSAATPAFRLPTAGSGMFDEVTRVGIAQGGADKAYYGGTNHDYVSVSTAGNAVIAGFADIGGGVLLATPPATKTGTYGATTADYFIPCDTTGGAFSVNLPAANSTTNGLILKIRKVAASANALTIDPAGAELIDGVGTKVVADLTTVEIQCDGTGWRTVGTMT